MWSFFPLRFRRLSPDRQAYTLLETLVCVTVVVFIMAAAVEFIDSTGRVYKLSGNNPYADVETAFDLVSSQLQGATLESYGDYADQAGAFRTNAAQPFVPDHLANRSDLDFVCSTASAPVGLWNGSGRTTTGAGLFFLAHAGYTQTLNHTGMERLLNAVGYFVEFGDSDTAPSFVGTHRWRWRLKRILQPSENLQVYGPGPSLGWIQNAITPGAPTSVLAENVFLLVALPERAAGDNGAPLAPQYAYDSRDPTQPATYNQLPVRVRFVLGAIDASSAQILAARSGSLPPKLVPGNLFGDATQLDADLATLDSALTQQKIGHRFFQRTVQLSAATLALVPAP